MPARRFSFARLLSETFSAAERAGPFNSLYKNREIRLERYGVHQSRGGALEFGFRWQSELRLGGGADTHLPDDAVGVLWEDDDFSAIVSRTFQQQGLISFFGFGDDQPLLCPPLIGATVLSGSSHSSLC